MSQYSSIIAGLLTLVRTGRVEGVHAARWLAGVRGIEGQLMAEGLLFAAVCEPVIDAYLGDQVGAQTGQLGRRDASLNTLRPEDITTHKHSTRNKELVPQKIHILICSLTISEICELLFECRLLEMP